MFGGGVQVLDSLGGRSVLLSDVIIMETRHSEVDVLMVLAVLEMVEMRSSTQPADSRASASWSQHSSIVSHSWPKP